MIRGKVFLDAGNRPYLITKVEDKDWLCYWHEHESNFVTLRPVKENEYFPDNLVKEQQNIYLDLHNQKAEKLKRIFTGQGVSE